MRICNRFKTILSTHTHTHSLRLGTGSIIWCIGGAGAVSDLYINTIQTRMKNMRCSSWHRALMLLLLCLLPVPPCLSVEARRWYKVHDHPTNNKYKNTKMRSFRVGVCVYGFGLSFDGILGIINIVRTFTHSRTGESHLHFQPYSHPDRPNQLYSDDHTSNTQYIYEMLLCYITLWWFSWCICRFIWNAPENEHIHSHVFFGQCLWLIKAVKMAKCVKCSQTKRDKWDMIVKQL